MLKLIFATIALLSAGAALAAKPVKGTGFTCTAADGDVKRFNIDLKKGRYDAGGGSKDLYGVNDTGIEIEGPNRYLAVDSGGIGPVFHSLVLDRATLVLTDHTSIPNRNIRRDTTYQCVMGPIIDFTAGRQF